MTFFQTISDFLGLPNGMEVFAVIATVFMFMVLTSIILSVFSSVFFILFNKID